MRCFKCNYDNVDGSMFCVSCGTKLDAGVNMSVDATVTPQPAQVDMMQDRPFSGQPIPTPAPQPAPQPQPIPTPQPQLIPTPAPQPTPQPQPQPAPQPQPIPTPAPQPTPQPQPAMYQTSAYHTPSYPYFGDKNGKIVPKEYKPISMWGYFGYNILFAIPFIGFIVLIIFALGGTSNINVRNYAKSYFCGLIIAVIIVAILVAEAGGLGMLLGFI